MSFLMVFLIASAHALSLEGDWVRVADGCDPLPGPDLARLPETGGFERMQRRMYLHIEADRFVVSAMPSPRCSPYHQDRGPDLRADHPFCGRPRRNSGSFTQLDASHFILVSEDSDLDTDENPWGVLFRHFRFEIRDDVLILQGPQSECVDGLYKLYFIRPPMS